MKKLTSIFAFLLLSICCFCQKTIANDSLTFKPFVIFGPETMLSDIRVQLPSIPDTVKFINSITEKDVFMVQMLEPGSSVFITINDCYKTMPFTEYLERFVFPFIIYSVKKQ